MSEYTHNLLLAIALLSMNGWLAFRFARRVPIGFRQVLPYSFVFHVLLNGYYWFYTLKQGGDALGYFYVARSGDVALALGTKFIQFLCSWFVLQFGANYYTTMLAFSFPGMFGLWFAYLAALENIVIYPGRKTRYLLYSMLFIPGLNFWTSAIGKDSVIMLGIGLMLYSLSRLDHRKIQLLLALTLVFAVRPHVAAAIGFVLVIALVIDRKAYSTGKLFLHMILGVLLVFILPAVTGYIGLEEINEQSVDEYIEARQFSNLTGGSSVDISGYSLVEQVLTYLYRPLFFDADGMLGWLVSLENLYYLLLSLYFSWLACKFSVSRLARISRLFVLFSFCYGLGMTLMLATTTANLGIAVRQKTMFIICLIALTAIYSSYRDVQNDRFQNQ